MNIHTTVAIFLAALASFQIAAMQQPNLRQQLRIAAYNGNNERVKELMLAGAPVDPAVLWYPTVDGNYDVVETIFECGVDPESPADPNQMHSGSTLFLQLVLDQELQLQVKEKLIKLYVKHGADIELRDPEGYSILIHGVHNIDFSALKMLFEQGAYANAHDGTGFTALMALIYASANSSTVKTESEKMIEQEDIKKAKLLIQYGADVNIKLRINGETCLFEAARQGNKPLVELLLENDANANLENQDGQSALDFAKNDPEILKLLKDAQKTKSEKS